MSVENLTDDGKVTKCIVKPGHGIKPAKKSEVSGMCIYTVSFFFLFEQLKQGKKDNSCQKKNTL